MIGDSQWDSPTKNNVGALYVFERSGGVFTEVAHLTPPSPQLAGGQMGKVVQVDNGLILTNARVLVAPGVAASAVLFWKRGPITWSYAGLVVSDNLPPGNTWKGQSLAMDSGLMLAGDGGFQAGNGRVVPFSLLEPVGTSYCPGSPNSTGFPSSLFVFGSESVAANRLHCQVTDLPASQFGILSMAASTAFVPLGGGSQGTLCLGSPLLRLSPAPLSTGSLGEVLYQVDLPSLAPTFTVQAGPTGTSSFGIGTSTPRPLPIPAAAGAWCFSSGSETAFRCQALWCW